MGELWSWEKVSRRGSKRAVLDRTIEKDKSRGLFIVGGICGKGRKLQGKIGGKAGYGGLKLSDVKKKRDAQAFARVVPKQEGFKFRKVAVCTEKTGGVHGGGRISIKVHGASRSYRKQIMTECRSRTPH